MQLRNNIEELRIFTNKTFFDVLCINETRLDQTIKNSEVEIHGYDLVRHDRNRHGGGVAIYIRDIIPYSERNSLIPDNIEAICLEIKKPNSKPILISTWYRPPNSNTKWLDGFEFFLQNVDNENIETVITGDFNIDLLPKENESSTNRRLLELLTTYQLQQIIDKPTRVTESTKTLLDLIICKTSDLKTIASGVINLGISDHNLVYISRKIGIPKRKPRIIETRQFNKLKVDEFQNDLRQAFIHFKDYTDPNIALHDWNAIFLQIADIHAPPRSKKVKGARQPWMTDEIKKLSFHRDYLKKKAVKLNSPAFYNSYKKCRNQVTERIKSAKTQYFKTNLENTKNSKETWDLINNLLNKKQKKTTINNLKIESETITGDENISNAFNNFFVEIGPKLAANIPPSDIDPTEYVRPCITEFNFTAITKTVLAATIKQIHTNKAPGLDKISNKLIKLAGNVVYDSLLHIFNLILDTGIFPEDLKLTRVTPIHKEGDKSKCGNYRPISVIPALAKILEKLICEQINSHIQ